MKPLNKNETGFVRYMTPTEFELIIQWIFTRLKYNPHTQMAFLTQAYLGLRVSEVVSLKRLDFNKNFSRLIFHPLKKRTKRLHSRAIPEILRVLLVDYNKRWNRRYREGYLFPPFRNQSKNNHITRSTILIWFTRLREDLGLMDYYYTVKQNNFKNGKKLYRISSHTFRHHFAWKIYVASDKDIRAVQQILGHKKINTTINYIDALNSAHSNYEKELVDKAFV
jgi:integrase